MSIGEWLNPATIIGLAAILGSLAGALGSRVGETHRHRIQS